jgi:flagellar biosynthesis protein FlhA
VKSGFRVFVAGRRPPCAAVARIANTNRPTVIGAATLDPRLEQQLLESLRPTDSGLQLLIDTARAESMLADLSRITELGEERGASPVLVCSPQLRNALRKLVLMALLRLPVLSYSEIAGSTLRIETIGVVNGAYPVAA